MQKPTIGRTVILHINDDNYFSGKAYAGEPIPAIITKVHEDGDVALTAFPAGMPPIPCYKVQYIFPDKPAPFGQCYWSWPVIEKDSGTSKKEASLAKTERAPSDDEQEEVHPLEMEVGKAYTTGVINGEERKVELTEDNDIVPSEKPSSGKISLKKQPKEKKPKE